MRQGRYFLGRVIKLGRLNQELFMDAGADLKILDHTLL